jgi:hypothetical protein
MNIVLLLLLFGQAPASEEAKRRGAGIMPALQAESPPHDVLIKQIADSGRVLTLVRFLDEKIRLAPGAPPLLAFRYLEGRQRGRFGGLDLVLDDAGH